MNWRDRAKAVAEFVFPGVEFAVRYFTVGFWFGLGFAAAVLIVVGLFAKPAKADTIPREALQYRSTLIRCARAEWGLNAPVAVFAGQIHQESRWNAAARSPVGAAGLGQIMPATAEDMAQRHPGLGPADVWNAGWSIRTLLAYDEDLWKFTARLGPPDDCEHMALALSSYNGGPGWLLKDAREARAHGLDQGTWFGSVETVNAGRSASAWRENRDYPRRILFQHAPLYERAGWGQGVCS